MAKRRFPYAETLVGVFVLLGLAVLFVVIIFLAGKQELFEGRFQVKAIFSQVVGLRAQSPVRLGGIEVGNVEGMEFNDQGKIVVTMSIQQRYQPQIRTDSSATIGSVGLLGDKTVEITVGSPTKGMVSSGSVLPSQDPVDITEVLDRVGPTIEGANTILANIAEFTETLKPEINSLSNALSSVGDILEKVNTGQGTLGALVNDPALYEQAKDLLESGRKMIGTLEVAAGQVKEVTTQFSKTTPDVQATLKNFRETSAQIKESSNTLNQSLDQFPTLINKAEKILDSVGVAAENVRRASSSFPQLVDTGQEALDEANVVLKATQKHWLLRRYVNKDEEAQVVTMDKRDQPHNREDTGLVNRTKSFVEKIKGTKQ